MATKLATCRGVSEASNKRTSARMPALLPTAISSIPSGVAESIIPSVKVPSSPAVITAPFR